MGTFAHLIFYLLLISTIIPSFAQEKVSSSESKPEKLEEAESAPLKSTISVSDDSQEKEEKNEPKKSHSEIRRRVIQINRERKTEDYNKKEILGSATAQSPYNEFDRHQQFRNGAGGVDPSSGFPPGGVGNPYPYPNQRQQQQQNYRVIERERSRHPEFDRGSHIGIGRAQTIGTIGSLNGGGERRYSSSGAGGQPSQLSHLSHRQQQQIYAQGHGHGSERYSPHQFQQQQQQQHHPQFHHDESSIPYPRRGLEVRKSLSIKDPRNSAQSSLNGKATDGTAANFHIPSALGVGGGLIGGGLDGGLGGIGYNPYGGGIYGGGHGGYDPTFGRFDFPGGLGLLGTYGGLDHSSQLYPAGITQPHHALNGGDLGGHHHGIDPLIGGIEHGHPHAGHGIGAVNHDGHQLGHHLSEFAGAGLPGPGGISSYNPSLYYAQYDPAFYQRLQPFGLNLRGAGNTRYSSHAHSPGGGIGGAGAGRGDYHGGSRYDSDREEF